MAKKVIISVINDLATDQRVHRTALTIHELGYEVTVVGRLLPSSLNMVDQLYQIKRFKLWFHKGPLFYLHYNIKLFFFLLKIKPDILFSNDLDTLPANFFVKRLKKQPLFYDSHEYFTGVPELSNRPLKRKIWKWLEGRMLPHVTKMFTVNESIANLYKKEYNVDAIVMRNTPELQESFLEDKSALRDELGLPNNRSIYILQGSGINIQRGAEEIVEAMQYSNGLLLIIGGGDVMTTLHDLVKKFHLEDKVLFKSKMPFNEIEGLILYIGPPFRPIID